MYIKGCDSIYIYIPKLHVKVLMVSSSYFLFIQVDNQLACMMSENSVDYIARFNDLAQELSVSETSLPPPWGERSECGGGAASYVISALQETSSLSIRRRRCVWDSPCWKCNKDCHKKIYGLGCLPVILWHAFRRSHVGHFLKKHLFTMQPLV